MDSKTYNTLAGRELWDWYAIRIEIIDDSKHVYFLSRIHVNKEVQVSFTFSTDFSDAQILNDNDLYTWIVNHYGQVTR